MVFLDRFANSITVSFCQHMVRWFHREPGDHKKLHPKL